MYLFMDKEKLDISFTCKLCLTEIKFSISAEDYKKIDEFPFKKEFVHGKPTHKLIVSINKNLEVEDFEIQDVLDTKDISYSEELTRQALSDIELTDEEIELYFLTTGRDVVSLGEISLLINKSEEECQNIAEKFVKKGLFKEIIGATPHFTALPPYAALISQLQKFHEYISDIKTNAPIQLNQSFSKLEAKTEGIKDLKDLAVSMSELKDNLLEQMKSYKKDFDITISEILKIKEINKAISNLEDDTKAIISDQIEELEKEFDIIKVLISKNLQKLQLGIIKRTVDKVIDNVLTTRLREITENFNNQFVLKIQNIIEHLINNIEDITTSTVEKSENVKDVFAIISKEFSKTIITSEEQLRNISEIIFKSIGDLRNTLSTKVINTLNEQLANILNRLDVSVITTKEFWDQARKVSLLTMKDIWFIRSIESIKSHIANEISKAKMRLLIVAPQITDINVDLLVKCPRHINIRIATFIDTYSNEHINILQKLDEMQNVSYRHHTLQNLWGINRDFEEVIICVVSKRDIGGNEKTEIGGIGSMVEEDIKIFAPILEEAWVKAQKKILYLAPEKISEPLEPSKPSVLELLEAHKTQIRAPESRIGQHPTSDKQSSSTLKPINKIGQPSLEESKPLFDQKTTSDVDSIQKESDTSHVSVEEFQVSNIEELVEYFEFIKENLDKLSPLELSKLLKNLHGYISNIIGYSLVLEKIEKSYIEFSGFHGILDRAGRNNIEKKIDFWKKKLNL